MGAKARREPRGGEERLLADGAAVVAGGSRGIGKAVSELLAACGAGVVINGRRGRSRKSTR
jgi:NAD(P)-dependent dehydrogenase (short-subunit alcohol dehydrogenase family)